MISDTTVRLTELYYTGVGVTQSQTLIYSQPCWKDPALTGLLARNLRLGWTARRWSSTSWWRAAAQPTRTPRTSRRRFPQRRPTTTTPSPWACRLSTVNRWPGRTSTGWRSTAGRSPCSSCTSTYPRTLPGGNSVPPPHRVCCWRRRSTWPIIQSRQERSHIVKLPVTQITIFHQAFGFVQLVSDTAVQLTELYYNGVGELILVVI